VHYELTRFVPASQGIEATNQDDPINLKSEKPDNIPPISEEMLRNAAAIRRRATAWRARQRFEALLDIPE
jgi:hypothetical protein